MRHRKKFNHLSRTSSHRKAMLSNMAASLILHKRINTTVAKAKALRGYIEPLITRSKDDTTHQRRMVFSYLQSKEAVTELFREISPKVAERPGGYTRIIKTGNRLGDNADMCLMELVDYNVHLLADKESSTEKPTGRRRRRGSGKGTKDEATIAPVAKKVVEKAATENEEPAIVEAEVEAPEVAETKPETPPDAVVKPEPEVEEKPQAEVETTTEPLAEAKADQDEKPVDTPESKAEPITDEVKETKEPDADEDSKDKKAE